MFIKTYKFIKKIKFNKFTNNNYKFTKFHKFKYKINKNLNFFSKNIFNYLNFFLVSSKKFYFKDYQFKAFKFFIKKPYNKFFKFRIFPFFGIFKKPAEVRMGKGKGNKIAFKIFPIKSGQIISSISFRSFFEITNFRTIKKISFYTNKLPKNFNIIKGTF